MLKIGISYRSNMVFLFSKLNTKCVKYWIQDNSKCVGKCIQNNKPYLFNNVPDNYASA